MAYEGLRLARSLKEIRVVRFQWRRRKYSQYTISLIKEGPRVSASLALETFDVAWPELGQDVGVVVTPKIWNGLLLECVNFAKSQLVSILIYVKSIVLTEKVVSFKRGLKHYPSSLRSRRGAPCHRPGPLRWPILHSQSCEVPPSPQPSQSSRHRVPRQTLYRGLRICAFSRPTL